MSGKIGQKKMSENFTQTDLIEHIKQTFSDCIAIVEKKNSDYAKQDDALSNFRNASLVGVTPERAILVRVADKLARISNILDKNSISVKDETVEDTLNDIINYLAILKAMIVH